MATLQEDLNKVYLWSTTWQMSFNVTKCFHLPITRKKRPIQSSYLMNGELVGKVDEYKYLGVTVSKDLRWSKHCQKVSSKARSTLGIVRRSLHSAPKLVKERAYQALVRPQLEYAAASWNPYTAKDSTCLQKVQNAAARFVCSDYRMCSSVSAMQESLGWHTLAQRRLYLQICMFYKIHQGLVNISFPPYITTPNRIPPRSPHPYQYLRVSCSKEPLFYSFFPRLISIWNDLSLETVSASSYVSFKSAALAETKSIVPPLWLTRI